MENKININTDMIVKKTDDDRTLEFIASKEISDRDGDVVMINGIDLKAFKKNPVILYGHDHYGLPVGKATKVSKVEDELRMKIKFATAEEYPFADTVYRLAKGGYLNAVSIGFIADWTTVEYPDKEKLKGKAVRRVINKSELLETSIVAVPANHEALATGKSISKAVTDSVITKEEAALLSITIDKDSKIIELESKIIELELLIKDQEIDEETEDDIYTELFNEFDGPSGQETDHTDEHTDLTVDDLL